MRVSCQLEVAAPLADVFALYSDIPNAAGRIPEIVEIEMLTPGPVTLGSRWRETREVMKKQAIAEMGITEFDPPRRYAVHCDSMGCDFLTTFRFTELAGRTEVHAEMVATPRTIKARLAAPLMLLMKGMLRKCLAGDLQALQKIAQARAGGTAAAAD